MRTSGVSPAVQRISVFCASSPGLHPAYRDAAASFGREVAHRGLGLVFGGGAVGLMGAVADAALAAGGTVTGVIPHGLAARDLAHPGVTDMRRVATMHERKALMAELSDAVVALPGGIGTLDELFEAFTWSVLGIHRKPIGVLEVQGYFEHLGRLLDRGVGEGFLSAEDRALLILDEDPARLLDRLATQSLPPRPTWLLP